MEQDYGKKYDEDVLKAFDKMAGDFGKSSPSFEEDDKPVSLEDIFGKESEKEDEKPSSKGRAKSPKAFGKRGSGKGPERSSKKGKKKKKHTVRKVILSIFLLFLAVIIIAAGVVGKYVLDIIKRTPEINSNNIYDLLSENSVLLDSDGAFMENIYSGDTLRTNVSYDEIPKHVTDAFIAIEDKSFKEHHGFNFVRIIGAIVDSIKSGGKIKGTSTITQQLARNLYLPETKSERSMERKIAEAYYTVILEKSLTKSQIMEAYLNTIYLGFNCNGIAAASRAYFDKDVKDLNLVEGAILAMLPKSPNAYSPLKRVSVSEGEKDSDSRDVLSNNGAWIVYYNDKGEGREQLVLKNMHEQELISDSEYEAAKDADMRSFINPGAGITDSSIGTSYFADYVVDRVKNDLIKTLDYSDEQATALIYKGGLTIKTTLNKKIQDIIESAYADTKNFPGVGYYRKDKAGNILAENGKILLYGMAGMFDDGGDFIIGKNDFEWQDDGSLKLFGGKHLNFYKTLVGEKTDYSVEFKPMFEIEDKFFYSRSGGFLNIPAEYKERDDKGDLLISSSFFEKYKSAFIKKDDGSLRFSKKYFTVADRVRQPQSAMVILDHDKGHIVGMIGGRDIKGKKLYNRALSTRQPGSSIKPISVYSAALQAGADGLGNFTAATPLDDRPVSLKSKPWPKNWYEGYTGMTNLRNALERSINTCAVNLYLQLDPALCIENLQQMGVTSLVTSGNVNDVNASALALGGMTKGISPLEMTGAYGTFGNYGVYKEPIVYTSVTNSNGDVILMNKPREARVLDEEVASVMLDIMRTAVTRGICGGAKIKSQPVAGKTGTTSEKYDIWFCGLTPKYTAGCWIGNDVNIPLSKGSDAATRLWATVMEKVGALDERGEFEMRGNIVTATVDKYSGKLLGPLSDLDPRGDAALTEKFVKGTVPEDLDDAHVSVAVCAETGYLATPYCTDVVHKICVARPGGSSWEKVIVDSEFEDLKRSDIEDAVYDIPDYYCPIHNPDTETYPVSPIYDGTAIDNPGSLEGGESEEGYWATDPETGLTVFIPYDDGASLSPEVTEEEGGEETPEP